METNQPSLVSKKGFAILPESGDWAFGVDLDPFVQTIHDFTNIMGGDSDADPLELQLINSNFYIKYFYTSKTAVRAKFNIMYDSETMISYGPDPESTDPDAEDIKLGSMSERYGQIALSLGLEKRAGETRLQGFYGAQATLALGSGTPGSPNVVYKYDVDINPGDPLKDKQGLNFGLGAGVFVGAEYFIAPNIAIGGDLNFDVMINTTGRSKFVYEGADGEEETLGDKSREFKIGPYANDVNSFGSIYAIFHF